MFIKREQYVNYLMCLVVNGSSTGNYFDYSKVYAVYKFLTY